MESELTYSAPLPTQREASNRASENGLSRGAGEFLRSAGSESRLVSPAPSLLSRFGTEPLVCGLGDTGPKQVSAHGFRPCPLPFAVRGLDTLGLHMADHRWYSIRADAHFES